MLNRSRSQGVRGHLTRASAGTGDERFNQTNFFLAGKKDITDTTNKETKHNSDSISHADGPNGEGRGSETGADEG